MPKFTSRINSKHEFNENFWLISVVNTGNRFKGHSVLVVEGITKISDDNASFFNQQLFVGRYDITAELYEQQDSSINLKGYINEVRIKEGSTYEAVLTRDYGQFSSKTHPPVEYIKVQKMLESIHADKKKVALSLQQGSGFLEFQQVGKNSLLADEGRGDNCAGWILEKLAIVGIGDGTAKPVPAKVSGDCKII